jgi:hypothetical protein
MSAEPTLATQLREMIVPPACVELIEQAAVRLDDLERQLAKAQYWRDRHCRESEQHAQRSGENWKAWKAAERQLATVAQATIKQCAKVIDPTQYPNECDRAIAWKCYDAIRALAPHAAKEPQAAQTFDVQGDSTELTSPKAASSAPACDPDHPNFAPGLALTAGGVCAKCGFTYWEHRGHIIACPVCKCARLQRELEQVCDGARGSMRNKDTHIEALQKDNARLRAVAEAAKAWMDHRIETDWDALVAAVRALERDEAKS